MLELSIVILIISLIAGSGAVIGRATLDSTQNVSTNSRLNVIETALQAFRLIGNRLPCPADGTLTESSADFGKEAANVGSCTGGTPAANFTTAFGSTNIVEGVVPVRTLNLPDEFMYDGWGRKIAYSVWAPMTSMRAFLNYGIQFNCGAMTIKDPSGNTRSSQTDYVLLSYGLNGHGAYTVQGTKYSSGSVNADEQANCHCNSSAVDTGYTATYVMKEALLDSTNSLNSFDDLLRYKERWQLQNYADQNNPAGGLTCPQGLPGFRSDGVNVSDFAGSSVATADINGDSIPDLIIGAPAYNASTGAVYVVFGTKNGFPDPLPLSTLNGTNGFRIDGVNTGDLLGASVAAADVNGDQIADVVMGAPGTSAAKGSAFVLFGSRSAWPATFALSTLTGTNGIRINGVAASGAAGSAVAAGDVNGDGKADVVIGAPNASTGSGYVYTVFGQATFASATYTLDNTAVTGLVDNAATKGFRVDPISAASGEGMGFSVAVGDTNGDGFADIVIGHPYYSANTGLITIIMGKGRGTWYTPIPSLKQNGYNGWHLFGVTAGDKYGFSVAVGDTNGDGIGDIIVGAPYASPGGRVGAGITYVLLGQNAYKPREFYTVNINSVNGYEIDGGTAGDDTGWSVAVGDINNDGLGDIIIGAPLAQPLALLKEGAVYVVFGSRTTPGVSFNLSTLNGSNGFMLEGSATLDRVGYAVAAGDVNGDNKSDLVAGAWRSSHGGAANSGSVYVYFGQRRTNAWTNPYNLSGL